MVNSHMNLSERYAVKIARYEMTMLIESDAQLGIIWIISSYAQNETVFVQLELIMKQIVRHVMKICC